MELPLPLTHDASEQEAELVIWQLIFWTMYNMERFSRDCGKRITIDGEL